MKSWRRDWKDDIWYGLWRPQAVISTNVWNKLRDKILIKIFECGWYTEFAKSSVCIILVASVYLESAKIYTGPKIVRVLIKVCFFDWKMYIQTELQYVMICVNALLYWDFFQATYFTGIVIHSRLGGANQT